MAGRFLFDAVYLQKFRMQPVRPLVEVLQNKKHRQAARPLRPLIQFAT